MCKGDESKASSEISPCGNDRRPDQAVDTDLSAEKESEQKMEVRDDNVVEGPECEREANKHSKPDATSDSVYGLYQEGEKSDQYSSRHRLKKAYPAPAASKVLCKGDQDFRCAFRHDATSGQDANKKGAPHEVEDERPSPEAKEASDISGPVPLHHRRHRVEQVLGDEFCASHN